MSVKKSVGVVIATVPVLLILVAVAFFLNNKNNNVDASEDDWTNIAEVSDEFLDRYFDDYKAMQEESDPENILLVTSKTKPETYGATKVVEAPNYLYMLSYENSVEKDAAFEKIAADGMTVEKNQLYSLMDETSIGKESTSGGLMSEEQIYQTMGTDEEDDYLSWGIHAMGLDKLHEEMKGLAELPTVTVAVLDSGMNQSEFDAYFPDRTLLFHCVVECGEGGVIDGASNEHGTHVGGTVMEGTLSNVQLMAIKITINAAGNSWNTDIITGINYAVAEGADVINMSLGGPGYDSALYNALQAADDAKLISVASAGNDNVSTLYYPASYTNTLSVAALRLCDTSEECSFEKASYSNYGAKIDFAAPGDMILGINNYYMSGTSQASPHVAAIVANLKSLNKDLTRAKAKNLLVDYSIDLGDEGWDQYYGWGMPNFYTTPGFCINVDCDNYGVFASHWGWEADTLIDAYRDGNIGFLITDRYLLAGSDVGPIMVISEKDGVYTRVMASDTDDDEIKVFYFDNTDSASVIHLAFVGDVSLNGKVNLADSLLINYSRLSTSNPNYAPLTDYQKAIADVNNNGNVNLADSLLIDYSRLSKTNANYRALEW